jgi:hypothetical protein
MFVFDLSMSDMNQIRVFIYKLPQALLIQDITGVSYLPEGYGSRDEPDRQGLYVIMGFRLKRKAY